MTKREWSWVYIATFAALLIGISLGVFLLRRPLIPVTRQEGAVLDIAPLYYQVQGAVSRELGEMEAYPTQERYYGKPVGVDFGVHPDAKKFYTRLTEGAAKGPNAAGHYTVIQIGWTGNGFYTYVVDARTGRIIVNGRLENSQWRFAIDSDLIVTDGIANPGYFYGPPSNTPAVCIQSKFLLLRDGDLKEIGTLSSTFGKRNDEGLEGACMPSAMQP